MKSAPESRLHPRFRDVGPYPGDDLAKCDRRFGVAVPPPAPEPPPPSARRSPPPERAAAPALAASPAPVSAKAYRLGPWLGCAFDYGLIGRGVRIRRWRMPPPRLEIHAPSQLNAVGIAFAVVEHLSGVRRNQLISPRRSRAIAYPRFALVALLAQFTRLSLPAMARLVGRGDHSTMINAVRRAAWLEANDVEFGLLIGQARREIARALGVPEPGTPGSGDRP